MKKSNASLELLVEIAYDRYVNDLSEQKIADKHRADQTTISRWLRLARDRRVISFNIDGNFAIGGKEDAPWSRTLRDSFDLKGSIVIEPDPPHPDQESNADHLHTALANSTGQKTAEALASGDHLAVAGGRAVCRFAQFIKRNPPSRRDIRITPLSGRLWTGSWQMDGPDNLERPLDADDSAFILGMAFSAEPGTRFSQISYPIYAESCSKAQEILRGHCAALPDGGWNWGLHAPNRGFVGVGVVDPRSGHRIAAFLRSFNTTRVSKGEAPYLARAAADLSNAMRLVEDNRLPFFGDIANRLFPALPLPSQLEDSDSARRAQLDVAYQKLNTKLERLNARAIVAQWAHLRAIGSVRAIAGGALKASALWTVLIAGEYSYAGDNSRSLRGSRPRKALITELSTDASTAATLVREHSILRKRPDLVAWYRERFASMQLFAS